MAWSAIPILHDHFIGRRMSGGIHDSETLIIHESFPDRSDFDFVEGHIDSIANGGDVVKYYSQTQAVPETWAAPETQAASETQALPETRAAPETLA